ncbi:MAG TPA: alpha/beta fold hydrolase [Terracidiphilus sp.]|jgi:pimeloyl-ACP methyl ester carboxylesterase|nr:alpha/beta fold hydrolase [Terracidiphilus sp.]
MARGTVLLNGASLAYRDAGNGRAVVFAHGHPFDQSMWDPQVAALSWKYRVITLDLRGYGASEVPAVEVITLETMAADIRDLLDHLGVDRAVVAGLSMGGQVAMAFVDLFPQRLAGLVLAATFAEAETPEGAVARRAMADRFASEGSVLPGGEMLPKLLAPASVKRDPALAVEVFGMIAHAPPAGAAAALRGRAMRKDYLEPLRHVAVPALIVVGAEDRFSSLDQARRMRDAIPMARLEVIECVGHMPNLEAADRFNALLHAYLAELAG